MSGLNISNLKPLQQKSLDGLMRQDVVAILPTGYGKSLIYELLPFWHFEEMGKPAIVLVLEPLNVIIEQQMQKLKEVSFFIGNSPHSEFDILGQNHVSICTPRSCYW